MVHRFTITAPTLDVLQLQDVTHNGVQDMGPRVHRQKLVASWHLHHSYHSPIMILIHLRKNSVITSRRNLNYFTGFNFYIMLVCFNIIIQLYTDIWLKLFNFNYNYFKNYIKIKIKISFSILKYIYSIRSHIYKCF